MSSKMKYKEIQNSQKDYLNLLKKFEGIIYSDTINQNQIAMILDEIECFWLSRKDLLSYELEMLTYQKECCIVSGSIYVNFEDNEHYMYKALGDEHFISEPFLKLEHFFRVPSEVFHNDSIDIFKRTYNDVLQLLTEYQNLFYIFPIEQIINLNTEERGDLLYKFYISFLNTMMGEEYKTLEEFLNKYTSYQELEDNMSLFFKNN